MTHQDTSDHEQFVQQTIACQGVLYAFVLSLTADPDWTDDVLQQTNLVLLRKEAEFTPGTNFKAWACNQAFYQVLASRKEKQRGRLVFDDELLNLLAATGEEVAERQDERRLALRGCLELLSDSQRTLLERRYAGESVQQMAAELERPVGSISQALYRTRQVLKECIVDKLAKGTAE